MPQYYRHSCMVSFIVSRQILWHLSHCRILYWCPRSHTLDYLYVLFSWLEKYIPYPCLIIVRSSTKNSSIGRYVMVFTIFMLYVLATILLGELWAFVHHAFIDEGQNCYTLYLDMNIHSPMLTQQFLVTGITFCISTFITDSSLVGNKRCLSYKIANHYSDLHL